MKHTKMLQDERYLRTEHCMQKERTAIKLQVSIYKKKCKLNKKELTATTKKN